jgi:hypothetical protein
MKRIICLCEKAFEVDLPDLIDLDSAPSYWEEVESGNFFSVVCPECGKKLKPELPVRLKSAKKGVDLLLVPEIERSAYYRGEHKIPKGIEIVIGFAELRERLNERRQGIDPRAVEIMKFYFCAKAEESNPDLDLLIFFRDATGEELEFGIQGLQEGSLGISKLSRAVYEKAKGEIEAKSKEEPFASFLALPYISIRNLERGEG